MVIILRFLNKFKRRRRKRKINYSLSKEINRNFNKLIVMENLYKAFQFQNPIPTANETDVISKKW